MTRTIALIVFTMLAGPAASADTDSTINLEALYSAGVDFDSYVDRMKKKKKVWAEARTGTVIPADVEYAASRIDGNWRLLVVSEELCHDSQNTVPHLAALADATAGIDLRIVDSRLGRVVMDSRRTPDDRGATPTVVILAANGADSGCWIERPAALQTFYLENKSAFRNADKHERERLEAEFMNWYRRDAGATTLREVIALVDAAARGARGCSAPTAPATKSATQ